MERPGEKETRPQLLDGFSAKVIHHPMRVGSVTNTFYRLLSSLRVLRHLLHHIKRSNTDLIICRTSAAGVFGSILSFVRGIPLVIESYEPHADYMADSGTWSRFGLKYLAQKLFEKIQRHQALALLTVSHNYERFLEARGKKDEVYVAPCPVDVNKFRFSEADRIARRKELGFAEGDIVGVYAGKFNDIYYTVEEAFALFEKFKKAVGGFKVIILSWHRVEEIRETALRHGFSIQDIFVRAVSHDEVSTYLSAADIGFCLVRPSPHRKYCCPIKTGEYWAAGLPVVIPEGIGDDSDIVSSTGLGVVLPQGGYTIDSKALISMTRLRANPAIAALARDGRSIHLTERAYESILERYRQREQG